MHNHFAHQHTTQASQQYGSTVTMSAEHQRLLKLASAAAVIVAVTLIALKLSAWLMSGSVSLLASLVDSTMDSMVSIINVFAVRYAMTPADKEHRFGHGKAEAVAGLAQAAFIAGSAGFLFLHAIDNILKPHPVSHTDAGLIVMGISIALTIALVSLQKYVVKKTHSNAIEADSVHYLSDILANASIIVALLLSQWGYKHVDASLGIIIAVFILHSAWQIGSKSLRLLLDEELGPEVWQVVDEIVAENPAVRGYHQLRTRQAGHIMFVQMHLELDKHMPLLEAHAITEEIEQAICGYFPNADVLIHTDPV
ncbi:MAG TPA: cation diffusion facilitator family transporter [Pseudomonadales bacterium]|nr:cation diffusion facilitator family transporter [Pseudomonadales bacterium]